jgi:hypothetical protein
MDNKTKNNEAGCVGYDLTKVDTQLKEVVEFLQITISQKDKEIAALKNRVAFLAGKDVAEPGTYSRMNPDESLLNILKNYSEITWGAPAYPLSTAEARYLLEKIQTLEAKLHDKENHLTFD